jgi:hypothetical protein
VSHLLKISISAFYQIDCYPTNGRIKIKKGRFFFTLFHHYKLIPDRKHVTQYFRIIQFQGITCFIIKLLQYEKVAAIL